MEPDNCQRYMPNSLSYLRLLFEMTNGWLVLPNRIHGGDGNRIWAAFQVDADA